MNHIQLAAEISKFAENLSNSITMEDKRAAVRYLADEVGVAKANQIAILFDLTNGYYHAFTPAYVVK